MQESNLEALPKPPKTAEKQAETEVLAEPLPADHFRFLSNIARDAAKHKSYAIADPAVFRSLEDTYNKNFYNRLRFPTTESAISLSRTVARAMRASWWR